MKCPECQKSGLKSRVTNEGSSSTLMYCAPFYDEEGRYHNHDSNIITTLYLCSNGHYWNEKSKRSCWCGWPNKEEADKAITGKNS